MKVLTFSMSKHKENLIKVECTFGNQVVEKIIPITSKPIRFVAVLDDEHQLADTEIITTD